MMQFYGDLILILDSTVRLAVPLIFACLAGLYSERAGIVDIGLEGKLLGSAFGAAAVAAVTGSPWLGLLAGIGVAVAFMGRAHPIGVGLSALLFGALYQGGQELAFSMPGITREMIVTIQALVILFTGAMGDMLRRPLERIFSPRADTGGAS